MFGKYEDSILIILLLVVSVLSIIVIDLKKDVNALKRNDETVRKAVNILQFANTRIFRVIESNSDSLRFFRKQMNQLHVWLGEVLGISNLIRNEKGEKDSSLIIEELRELVKWTKEKNKQTIDEKDYYKGD